MDTAQQIGIFFVKVYYTVLSKAPAELYKLYGKNSSFVHGNFESYDREPTPASIGPEEIKARIEELEFEDCRTRILKIDCQSTIEKGVVVQVTGELSNAGRPVRPFTQTFLLVPLSLKKYYVFNDIFRYQDYVLENDYEPSIFVQKTKSESIQRLGRKRAKPNQKKRFRSLSLPRLGYCNGSENPIWGNEVVTEIISVRRDGKTHILKSVDKTPWAVYPTCTKRLNCTMYKFIKN